MGAAATEKAAAPKSRLLWADLSDSDEDLSSDAPIRPVPVSKPGPDPPSLRGDSHSYRSHASADDISLAGRMDRINGPGKEDEKPGQGPNFAGVEELEAAQQNALAKRDRNLDKLKAMPEYVEYCNDVPKTERVCDQPHTPRKNESMRKFKVELSSMIRWLKENYGPEEPDSTKEAT